MSDLTATNCGCANNSNTCCNRNGFFGGSCIWIFILLFFCNGNGCGNCGSGLFGRCGDDCDNNCCEWLIWILLLSCFCGNGCGNSCGSSCC